MATPFKLDKKKFDFGNKGNFDFKKKNKYSSSEDKKGFFSEHNIHARKTEGTIKEQEKRTQDHPMYRGNYDEVD